MTPREKAIELMDKYWELDVDDKAPVWTEKCKKCVLIAVDEILGYMGADRGYAFWEEVKQEINKL